MSDREFLTKFHKASENTQKAVYEILALEEKATLIDVERICNKYGITPPTNDIQEA